MKRSLSIVLATLGLVTFLQSCANLANKKETSRSQTPEKIKATEVTQAVAYSLETKIDLTSGEILDPLIEFDKNKAKHLTNNAKLMAGIKVKNSSFANSIQKANYWMNHQSTLNNSWEKLETRQLSKVRKWSSTALSEIHEEAPDVFYPFSGPDF